MNTRASAASFWLALLSTCAAGGAQVSPAEPIPATPRIEDAHDQDPGEGLDLMLMRREEERGLHFGGEESFVAIHGFLDFEYKNLDASPAHFDLYHTLLFFEAVLSERVEAYVEVEYEHASEEIELDQTEIRYRPEGSDLLLAAGRFYAPFGVERLEWYPTSNVLASRPQAFRQIVPGNWYETGVRAEYESLLADIPVKAEIAVTNGLGASAATDIRGARQTRDGNHNEALIGRVGATPVEGLSVGVSGATMKYDDTNSISFVGVDAEYRTDQLLVRGELIKSSVEDRGGPVGDFDREGYYLLATWRVFEHDTRYLDLGGRFDWVDTNTDLRDAGDLSIATAGLRWGVDAGLALKAEYRVQQARGAPIASSDGGFVIQVVVEF